MEPWQVERTAPLIQSSSTAVQARRKRTGLRRMARCAGAKEIGTIDRTPGHRAVENRAMRPERLGPQRIAAMAPLAADVVVRVCGLFPLGEVGDHL